jgi:hypothetical protein
MDGADHRLLSKISSHIEETRSKLKNSEQESLFIEGIKYFGHQILLCAESTSNLSEK